MKKGRFVLISKYNPPWVGVPLIKNMDNFFKEDISFISKNSESNGILSLVLYLISIQFKILNKSQKCNNILIYNDLSLVILTFPLLKIISLYREINCYYIFESKWFSKYGSYLEPFFRNSLNSPIYKKIFIFDDLLGQYLKSKGIYNSKFVNISTGIDFNLFYTSERNFDFELLYVGSLHKRRKLEMMINAIELVKRKYNKIHLTIVGDGSDIDNLKRLSSNLHLDKNISFIGSVGQDKVPNYILNSDICLAPYPPEIFDIQLPYKTLEYMACKKPVITTKTLATNKYFKNKKNALLTDFNKNSLADAIILLIKDKKLMQKISKEGYKLSKNFTWEKVMSIIDNELIYTTNKHNKKSE